MANLIVIVKKWRLFVRAKHSLVKLERLKGE